MNGKCVVVSLDFQRTTKEELWTQFYGAEFMIIFIETSEVIYNIMMSN